jgi:hypothetical protein
MSATTSERHVSIGKWILVTGVITLAITIIRLVGELQHWNSALFNPEAGGGGALVGIVWLVPILGIYFGLKLNAAGLGPQSAGRVILFAFIGIALNIAIAVVGTVGLKMQPGQPAFQVLAAAGGIIAILILRKQWPALFKTLLGYGYAARIPVAILMLVAIKENWGTHYDVPPTPEFPAMHWLAKWFWIGAIPQLVDWIAFTMMIGSLFAAIAVAIAKLIGSRRRRAGAHAAAAS